MLQSSVVREGEDADQTLSQNSVIADKFDEVKTGSSVMLGTMQIRLQLNQATITDPIRGLCDNGSQINLITEHCVQQLRIRKNKQKTPIIGIGSTSYASGHIDVHIVHRLNNEIIMPARFFVISKISASLPENRVEKLINNEHVIENLADESYHLPGKIEFLIGAGTWAAIVHDQIVRETKENRLVIAQRTLFGWVMSNIIKGPDAL